MKRRSCDICNLKVLLVCLLPLALPVAAGGYFFAAKLPVSFLYQAQGYSSFGLASLSGIKARMICYITAAACSVLVLFLCPKRKYAWTQWGGNTLMPYLLHPVFIGCLTFIPYAPRYAVPVSFVPALIALLHFSVFTCVSSGEAGFFFILTQAKNGSATITLKRRRLPVRELGSVL